MRRTPARNVPKLLAIVLLLLSTLSCDQQPLDSGPDVMKAGQERSAQGLSPAARVDLDGLAQAEALLPFGMLRLHPVLTSGAAWLGFRHARSVDGIDLEIRWLLGQVPQPADMVTRGGPGWFSVSVPGEQNVEATVSQRGAHYRLQLPSRTPLTLRLAWLDSGTPRNGVFESASGRRSISGRVTGKGGETLFAMIRFSRAFRLASPDSDGGLEIIFDAGLEPIEFALALSTVDVNGARANLESPDVPDFALTQRRARDVWNASLGRLDISGDEVLRQRAYTALYRLLSAYGDITDSDGQYRSASDEVRRIVRGKAYFGNLSPADNYRTVIPMLSLLEPGRMADLFSTIMTHQRTTGDLPRKTVWGRARSSPALVPAAPAIATLVSRQLPGIDDVQALPPLLKSFLPGGSDFQWAEFERLGYFSFDTMPANSVSRSLTAGLAHHATAAVAAQLGERELAEAFAVRMLFYRQLFDPQSRWFRGRDNARAWRSPFNPENAGPGSEDFLERDPWAALWSVAQFDVEGLLSLLGGRQELTQRLDSFFWQVIPLTGDGPHVDSTFADASSVSANNETGAYRTESPAHWHVPWLYPLSNEPGRGQQLSRSLFEQEPPTVQTPAHAAWDLFTLLGFYPVMPSRGDYILGIPQVASASLDLGGAQLFIEAPGLPLDIDTSSDGIAGGASFDGARLPGFSVSHRRVAGGGTLTFLLPQSAEPATSQAAEETQ